MEESDGREGKKYKQPQKQQCVYTECGPTNSPHILFYVHAIAHIRIPPCIASAPCTTIRIAPQLECGQSSHFYEQDKNFNVDHITLIRSFVTVCYCCCRRHRLSSSFGRRLRFDVSPSILLHLQSTCWSNVRKKKSFDQRLGIRCLRG